MTNSTYAIIANESSFTDTSGKWYEAVADELSARKIAKDIYTTAFEGDRDITRAEFAALIVNALGLPQSASAGYSDFAADRNQVGTWAAESVSFNLANGLIVGRSNGTIDPKGNITRGETATVILRLLQRAKLVDVRAGA